MQIHVTLFNYIIQSFGLCLSPQAYGSCENQQANPFCCPHHSRDCAKQARPHSCFCKCDVWVCCPTEVLHFSQSNHFQECSFMPSDCLRAIPCLSQPTSPALQESWRRTKRGGMRRHPQVHLWLVEKF